MTPHLVVADGEKAIAFYKAAFAATEARKMVAEDGKKVMHCDLHIDGAKLYLCDDFPEYAGVSRLLPAGAASPVTIHLDVPDTDAAMAKAAAAGGTITMPAWDAFWGDRYGKLTDPFGHDWSFSTPLKAAG